MNSDEAAMRHQIVAKEDGKPGCPESVWDGPYRMRCGLGVNRCYRHGKFPTRE